MEKWNYEVKRNYIYVAKVKMDPRKRMLQEAFTCMRGTFLPLSCLGFTHLTQMHSRCRLTWNQNNPNHPINTLSSIPGPVVRLQPLHCHPPWHSLVPESHPSWKTLMWASVGCRGCVCTEQAGLGHCWGHRAVPLPCLDAELVDAHTAGNKSKAGLSLLHPPSQAFQCDSHLLKLSFCAAHRA